MMQGCENPQIDPQPRRAPGVSYRMAEVAATLAEPGTLALFGRELGLESIDALEIALAVSKRYGFQLRSDNPDNRQIFTSLRTLSAHVEKNRVG